MSFLPTVRRNAMFAALLITTSAAGAAPPPTPAGWTTQAAGDVQVYSYRHDGHQAEMRLFAIEAAPSSFDDWFAVRVARPCRA